jgi:hypothetical protein
MKISRTSPLEQPGSLGKSPSVGGATGKEFEAKLGAVKSAGVSKAPGATGKSAKTRKALPVSDIGADLKAGRLTPQAALDKVIERVLDRQVGRNAGADVRQKIGTALRESLADDPFLASKIRALGLEE